MCSLLFKSKKDPIIYPLNNNKITIGSSLNADIRLNNANIEPVHCVIIYSKEKVILENRSIENPVILNGCQLKTKEILNHGDKISINDKEFEFSGPKQKEKFKFKSILTRKSLMPSMKMQTVISASKIPLPQNRMTRLSTRKSVSMSASKASITNKSLHNPLNLRTNRLPMSTGKMTRIEKRTTPKPSLRVSLFKSNLRLSEESPPDCLNNVTTTVQNDLQTIQSITPSSSAKRQKSKSIFDKDNSFTSKLEENQTEDELKNQSTLSSEISFNETSNISVQQSPITLSEDDRLSTTRRSLRRKSNQLIENSSTPTNTPKKNKDVLITDSEENETAIDEKCNTNTPKKHASILKQLTNIEDSPKTIAEDQSTTTRMYLRRSNQLHEKTPIKNISATEELTNEEEEEAEQLLKTSQFEKTNLETIENNSSILEDSPLVVPENHQSLAVRRSVRRNCSNLNVKTPKKHDSTLEESVDAENSPTIVPEEDESTPIRKSMGRKSDRENMSDVKELSEEEEIEKEEEREIPQEGSQLLMPRKLLRRKSTQFENMGVKTPKKNVSLLNASIKINDSSTDVPEDQQSPAIRKSIRKSNNLSALMDTSKKYDSILEQSANIEDIPVTVTEENQMPSNIKPIKTGTPIKDRSIVEDSPESSTEENESLVTEKLPRQLSTKTPKKNVLLLDASMKINDSSTDVPEDQQSPALRKSARRKSSNLSVNTPKKHDSTLEESIDAENSPIIVPEEDESTPIRKSMGKKSDRENMSVVKELSEEEEIEKEEEREIPQEGSQLLMPRKSLRRKSNQFKDMDVKTPKKNVSFLNASMKINESSTNVPDQQSPAIRKSIRKTNNLSALMDTSKKYDSILEQSANIEDIPVTVTEENQMPSNIKPIKTGTPIKDRSIVEDSPEVSREENESLVTEKSPRQLSTKTPKKNVSLLNASMKIDDSSIVVPEDQQSPALRKSVRKSNNLSALTDTPKILEQSSNIEDFPMTVTEESQVSSNVKSVKTDTPIKDWSVFEESSNIQDSPVVSTEESELLTTKKSFRRLSTNTPKKNISTIEELPETENSIQVFNNNSKSIVEQDTEIAETQTSSTTKRSKRFSKVVEFEEIGPRGVKRIRESTGTVLQTNKKKKMLLETTFNESNLETSTSDDCSDLFAGSQGHIEDDDDSCNDNSDDEIINNEDNRPTINNSNIENSFNVNNIETIQNNITINIHTNDNIDNISGIKELFTPPKELKSPVNDLSNVDGVKRIFKTPKVQKTPRNDLSKIDGVKKLFKTPKVHKSPLNDLTKVEGIQKVFATPKRQKSPVNDLTKIEGISGMFKTPKQQKSPNNDLTKIVGVKKMFTTPKEQKSPKNDLTNVDGIKKIFSTSKKQKSPRNDLTEIVGVKKIFATPNIHKSPENDLSRVGGVKKMFTTPKVQKTPKNDLTQISNIKNLMKTPKPTKSPSNDLITNVSGIKCVLKTPKPSTSNDNGWIQSPINLKGLFEKNKSPLNDLSNVEGIDVLYQEIQEETKRNKRTTRKSLKETSTPVVKRTKRRRQIEETNDDEPEQQDETNTLNELVENSPVIEQRTLRNRKTVKETKKEQENIPTPVIERKTRRGRKKVDEIIEEEHKENISTEVVVEEGSAVEQKSRHGRKENISKQGAMQTSTPIEKKTGKVDVTSIQKEENEKNIEPKLTRKRQKQLIDGTGGLTPIRKTRSNNTEIENQREENEPEIEKQEEENENVIESKLTRRRQKQLVDGTVELTPIRKTRNNNTEIGNQREENEPEIEKQKEENENVIESKLTRRRQKRLADGTESLTAIRKTRSNKAESAEIENQKEENEKVIEPKLTRRRQKQLVDGTQALTPIRKTRSNKAESPEIENQEDNIEEKPTRSTRRQKRIVIIEDKAEDTSVKRTRKESNNDNQLSIAEEKSVSTTKRSTRKRQKSMEENENNQSAPSKRQTRKKASEKENIEEDSKENSGNEASNEESSKRTSHRKVEENQQTKSTRSSRKKKIEENQEAQPEGGRVLRSRKK